MKKILLSVCIFFFAVFFVFGDSWYVRANGNDNNTGLSEDLPFRTLAKAVQAASGSAVKTITVIGTLDHISENSSNEDSVFYIRAGNEELITITGRSDASENERAILDASGSGRRAVYVTYRSYIHFEHIDITGGENTNIDGGGIYISYTTVSVGTGTRIYGNSADAGGGIYVTRDSDAKFIMRNGEIYGNTAKWGGGIYSHNEIDIEGAKIYENYASSYGGGIEVDGSKALLKSCYITGNRTGSGGGGIFAVKDSILDIIDCDISENEGNRGGGLATQGTVTMSGGMISKNKTRNGTGGGVNVEEEGSFTMKGGIISENTCPMNSGGGIAVLEGGKCFIEDGIISKNRAGNENEYYGGGGIIIAAGAEFSMNGGSITENIAGHAGGGISIEPGVKCQIRNVCVSGNIASIGGGIGLAGELELFDSIIVGNYAKSDGGGVWVFIEGGLNMRGGEASGNHANGIGGACRFEGTAELYSVKIFNNQSVLGGGICTISNLLLQDCIISNNKAFYGGGLYTLNQQTSTVNNCDINNNFAFYSGAAVYISGSTVSLNSVKISGNKTIKGGGIFLGSGGSLAINSGTIVQNTANQGNSIYMEKGALLRQENIVEDRDIFEEE